MSIALFLGGHGAVAAVADRFDYPFGNRGAYTEADDGDGWRVDQEFGEWNSTFSKYHLGEDWNAESGGNMDCGTNVYSIANGTIVYANIATGWGRVLIIRHSLPDGSEVESQYGHLGSFAKTSGDVTRGEIIGAIGDGSEGGTTYPCHLHLEIRTSACPNWGQPGPGYSASPKPVGWTDPSDFLDTPRAQEARFFRIAGPVATIINALSADGYVTWSNAATNATFTVQIVHSLLGQINWVDYVRWFTTNPVTTIRIHDPNPPSGTALIPAGSFQMGDSFGEGISGDETPVHSVAVSAFYMDRNEVTKVLWDEVYLWATNHGYEFDNPGLGKAPCHPVHTVNWYDAVKWLNARSEKESKIPAYYMNAALTAIYRTGRVDLSNDWVKWDLGYRLPTEAEWEKAARGGLIGKRFPWGDTISHSQANCQSFTNIFYDYPYDISPTRGFHPAFRAFI